MMTYDEIIADPTNWQNTSKKPKLSHLLIGHRIFATSSEDELINWLINNPSDIESAYQIILHKNCGPRCIALLARHANKHIRSYIRIKGIILTEPQYQDTLDYLADDTNINVRRFVALYSANIKTLKKLSYEDDTEIIYNIVSSIFRHKLPTEMWERLKNSKNPKICNLAKTWETK